MDRFIRQVWPSLCIAVGLGVFLFGLSGFLGGQPASYRDRTAYLEDARVAIAVGAALVACGWLFRRKGGPQ